jgi:hypothetical protein
MSVYHAAVLLLLYLVRRSTFSLFFVRMTFKVPRLTNAGTSQPASVYLDTIADFIRMFLRNLGTRDLVQENASYLTFTKKKYRYRCGRGVRKVLHELELLGLPVSASPCIPPVCDPEEVQNSLIISTWSRGLGNCRARLANLDLYCLTSKGQLSLSCVSV